jgi:predicted MFS family arabinose efflux permease
MTTRAMNDHAQAAPSLWRATLSGLSGSLVGIGLARFSYTPLLPAIIAAGWFDPSDAAYLGAANLAGYLAGALLAARLASRLNTAALLNAMMLLATAAFFASAWPIDFAWFFAWRFASGLAGGVIMVLAATSILPHITPARRGLMGGAIFMGVGLGIAASGTLVPLLLHQGLTETWIGLGLLSLVMTVLAWGGWPKHAAPATTTHHPHAPHPSLRLRALYVEYGLNAAGLVAHLLFLVDYVARGRGEGLAAGAEYWVLFGIGAVLGPVVSGRIGDRIGFGATLRLAFGIQAVAVIVPAFNPNEIALMLSSFFVGALTPGIVPIVLGRVHELLPHAPAQQRKAWSRATTSFAVLQAAAAYGMSYLFSHDGGNYSLLFVLAAAAILLALAIDLAVGRLHR